MQQVEKTVGGAGRGVRAELAVEADVGAPQGGRVVQDAGAPRGDDRAGVRADAAQRGVERGELFGGAPLDDGGVVGERVALCGLLPSGLRPLRKPSTTLAPCGPSPA
ncbi:hypothetical protein ACI1MP_37265 (plasmid) [Kitasatospora griseola]|uniref:hypothetical protein n=1 Tax=Kitasatospora griseola TaxID=2064 RepID=UPI0038558D2B